MATNKKIYDSNGRTEFANDLWIRISKYSITFSPCLADRVSGLKRCYLQIEELSDSIMLTIIESDSNDAIKITNSYDQYIGYPCDELKDILKPYMDDTRRECTVGWDGNSSKHKIFCILRNDNKNDADSEN